MRDSKATDKQQRVLDYVKQQIKEEGYAPSVREICKALDLKSTSTVHGYLSRLKKKGLIEKTEALTKENEQLKANIESSLNLNNVEKTAIETFGMTKLDNGRTVYINIPKQDYVQSATEEVVIEENDNWFDKVTNWITNIIK